MVFADVAGRYGKGILEPFLRTILRYRIASMNADIQLVSSPTTWLQEPVVSSPTCLLVAEIAAGGIYLNLVADHSHETPAAKKEKWPLQVLKATVGYMSGTIHMVQTSLSDLIYTRHWGTAIFK
ncbi:hypothetical protein INS49_002213 [Diaporthe citri]|uniref:uncharacterized protein n=1 Tax=Diaporthe citri TaxID=83186 RepID=UPI001C7F9C21|nr:uncharacterized protein INS49_002213 [Diaporthe citri]KAG6368013.1 hypothetical protein INS49_002213 [Diaporthe citri]